MVRKYDESVDLPEVPVMLLHIIILEAKEKDTCSELETELVYNAEKFLKQHIFICPRVQKEVVHFGNLLHYFFAASARNRTLKTLQPGHWEVKEFFYAKLGTFRDLR